MSVEHQLTNLLTLIYTGFQFTVIPEMPLNFNNVNPIFLG